MIFKKKQNQFQKKVKDYADSRKEQDNPFSNLSRKKAKIILYTMIGIIILFNLKNFYFTKLFYNEIDNYMPKNKVQNKTSYELYHDSIKKEKKRKTLIYLDSIEQYLIDSTDCMCEDKIKLK